MKENDVTNRHILMDAGYDDSIVFENPDYDDAIIGVSEDGSVVYDFNRMVSWLAEKDNISLDEAIDFICFNTIGVLPYIGDGAPIIITLLKDL